MNSPTRPRTTIGPAMRHAAAGPAIAGLIEPRRQGWLRRRATKPTRLCSAIGSAMQRLAPWWAPAAPARFDSDQVYRMLASDRDVTHAARRTAGRAGGAGR